MHIGMRIRYKRKELNLSAEDLGKMLGKNRATIYRYESNEIENLPLSIIEPLAIALKTTPSYLMGWDNNQKDFFDIDKDIAAHLDGEVYSDDDKKSIISFIDFVNSKNKK